MGSEIVGQVPSTADEHLKKRCRQEGRLLPRPTAIPA